MPASAPSVQSASMQAAPALKKPDVSLPEKPAISLPKRPEIQFNAAENRKNLQEAVSMLNQQVASHKSGLGFSINDSIDVLKISVKEVHECLHKNSEETHLMLKELNESGDRAHLALSSKISSLEKWRWTMMGAGLVVGSLGFDAIAKLLK
jgi:hypothetical protein